MSRARANGFTLPDALAALAIGAAIVVGLGAASHVWRRQERAAHAQIEDARLAMRRQAVLERAAGLLGQAQGRSGGAAGPNLLTWPCESEAAQPACRLEIADGRLRLLRGEAMLAVAPAPEGARLRFGVGGEWIGSAAPEALSALAVIDAAGAPLAQIGMGGTS